MSKITRESWEQIAEEIIYIVESNSGDQDAMINELEGYLEAEGIIEIIPD